MRFSLARRCTNRILHLLARFLPGAETVRPFLHRMRGVGIQGRVFIGDDVYLENDHPECVEIHDQAIIGLRSTLIAHTRGCGRIVIESQAMLGVGCTILCSPGKRLTIGKGAVIGAGSVITTSVPPMTFFCAPRASAVARVTVPLTKEASYDQFVAGLRPI